MLLITLLKFIIQIIEGKLLIVCYVDFYNKYVLNILSIILKYIFKICIGIT